VGAPDTFGPTIALYIPLQLLQIIIIIIIYHLYAVYLHIRIYPKETMFLRFIVLQLFCVYNLCYMFCTVRSMCAVSIVAVFCSSVVSCCTRIFSLLLLLLLLLIIIYLWEFYLAFSVDFCMLPTTRCVPLVSRITR